MIDTSPDAFTQLIQSRILVGLSAVQEEDVLDDGTFNFEQFGNVMIDTSKSAQEKKPKSLEEKVFLDMLITGKTSQVRELAE